MDEKKSRALCSILAIAVLILSYIVLQIIQPGYLIRSAIKVVSFSSVIILYAFLSKKKITEIINFKKPEKIGVLLGCIALFFVGIGILFLIFRSRINMDSIRQSLIVKEGITKSNCLFAFTYIIVFNSFLEEAFFRGFYPNLFKNKPLGYIISAIFFSTYHIGIVATWFKLPVFIICVTGLVLVGLFLQWVSLKYKTIVANWIVHASANVAINIIGALLLFEVI